MRTAWVLPGGSTFGAIQAGLVTSLFESGVEPDMVVGTSVGSLNAAWLAGDPTPGGAVRLRELWLSMRRSDVFGIQPSRVLAGKLGLTNHLISNHGLARWLHQTLPFRRLEDARIPLTVTATDVDTGEAVYFDRGPALPPLVASCSIPGMFPPINVDGRWLVDGGPAAFMPISRAVEQGAERVYVLPCGGTEPFQYNPRRRGIGAIATWPPPKIPPRSISGVNGAALGAAMVAAARLDLQLNATRCELYVLPAPSVIGLSPYSFEHASALIDAAWEIGKRWFPTARPVPEGPVDIGGRPLGEKATEPA
ncbi:patatin-like phospholipase family protein [Saccharopolyspora taberi]